MVKLEARLPAVLKGEDRVADGAELEAFKEVCRLQKRFAAAAKLFEVAFTAAPNLADDVKREHRFRAACFAALAVSAPAVTPINSTTTSAPAFVNWPWSGCADLAHWTMQSASDKPADRDKVQQMLQHWLSEPDLANMRNEDAVAKLPAEERAAWDKLWAEVAEVLKKVGGGK